MALRSLSTSVLAMLGASTRTANALNSTTCNTATFQSLTLSNIEIISLNATAMYNVSSADTGSALLGESASTVDYCQVWIQYTHPGQYDTVNTYIGLPLEASNWNSRFLMNGGGGWVAGGAQYILPPLAANYSTSSTDGGHTTSQTTAEWGLVSEGNTNWPAIQDFASVALNEAATLGKMATEIYFGSAPIYSYWNGCSTGGRQGHMMAQRFPTQFDGILGGAPAINWEKFMSYEFWPYFMSNIFDTRPPSCVFNAFTEAAIAACDTLDGVEDDIISYPGLCDFDALSIVGQAVNCSQPSGTIIITEAMANLVNAIWQGAVSVDGVFEWYAIHKDANLTGLLTTTCTTVDNCTAAPFSIGSDWFQVFLARNSTYNYDSMTRPEFDQFHRQSIAEYTSVIGTDDADLTDLKKAGTKFITWHGMQDQLIPTNGTIDYYSRVMQYDPDVQDYYRFFLAPGVAHCGGGTGFDASTSIFQDLLAWVEDGIAPDTIAVSAAAVGDNTTATRTANLCAYPKVFTYIGPDPNDAASFTCV